MPTTLVIVSKSESRLAPLAFLGRGAAAQDDYFQQFVHYTIRASLDTKNHMLTGSERILYANNAPDTLSEIYLHLYPNAYRGEESALITHYRKRFNYSLLDIPKKFRGYLEISNVTVDGAPVGSWREAWRRRDPRRAPW